MKNLKTFPFVLNSFHDKYNESIFFAKNKAVDPL